jgi:hypothetical protein
MPKQGPQLFWFRTAIGDVFLPLGALYDKKIWFRASFGDAFMATFWFTVGYRRVSLILDDTVYIKKTSTYGLKKLK